MKKPERLIRIKPRWRYLVFGLSGVFLIFSLLCILVTLFFPAVGGFVSAHPFALSVISKLQEISQPRAFAAVISLVGVTGVLTGLIASTDREVFGISLAALIRGAYPDTYESYFALFLPLVVLGVYAGTWERRVASMMAACGLLVLAPYLLRICYLVLLNQETREKIIYTYYSDTIDSLRTPCKSASPEEKMAWKREIYSTVQSVSLSAHKLLAERSRIRGKEIMAVWRAALDKLLPKESASTRYKRMLGGFLAGATCDELMAVSLMESAWKSLISSPVSTYLRKFAVEEILHELGRKKTRTLPDTVILAGLVLAIEGFRQRDGRALRDAWRNLLQILGPINERDDDQELSLSLQADLIRSFGIILSVDVIQKRIPSELVPDESEAMEIWNELIKLLPETEERKQLRWEASCIREFPYRTEIENPFCRWENVIKVFDDSAEANRELLLWLIDWSRAISHAGYCGFLHTERLRNCFTAEEFWDSAYYEGNVCFHELLLRTLFEEQ